MTNQEMINEHKRLVEVLLHGTDAQRKTEAVKQMKELKTMMSETKPEKANDKKSLAIKGLV
jgi:hypothetical protein